jgi:prepilin-type N-terminal cleavage/methylation domain-containing protein
MLKWALSLTDISFQQIRSDIEVTMRRRLQRERHADSDAGMSLVELMVAIVLFGLLSGAALTTLNLAINTTRHDRNRATASTLAERELEITRNQFNNVLQGPKTITVNQVTNPNPLPGGTVGQPLVVDGTKYTVVREAEWSTPTGLPTSSPCDNGGTAELAYLHVHVEVTWSRMGSIPPVVNDTLLAPPKGTYAANTGHIGVKVVDRNGAPLEGVPVIISGASTGSGVTSGDGCAVFAFLPVGNYTVKTSKPGYVNSKNVSNPSYAATVQIGQMTKVAVDYDQAAALNISFDRPSGGYNDPATIPYGVTLANSGLVPSGMAAYTGTGSPRTLSNLWPYLSGYQLWAGDCLDADPQYYGGARTAPVAVDPGVTASPDVDLQPVDISVMKLSTGLLQSGLTIVATHAPDAGCPSGESYTLGVTNSGGVKAALPYGKWTLSIASPPAGATTQVITLTPTAPSAIAGLVIA